MLDMSKPLSETERAERPKIGVLTSGGDAQGMNAVVRAVVRTALHAGAIPFALHEGWKGAIEGGDLIQELSWSSVSNILSKGGTAIGTARSAEFRERSGLKKVVHNLVERGIDRLIAVGGDGTLTGADELREMWPELLEELVAEGSVSPEAGERHKHLRIAGVVGSIDNDLVGTDMTIGTDSALHRIIEAIDAIAATAASHQRTFIIEVMGRACGYLALMSAIAGGCDYVFIPELPPEDGWEEEMTNKLRTGRERGRRDSLIILAEGALDRAGNPITATQVADVIRQRLGEDARITSLGHVQRGGQPTAYDRWMPTLLGYTAALDMVNAGPETQPTIIGTQRNRIVRMPMMEAVANTRKVKAYLKEGNWEAAIDSRGAGFREMINIFEAISSPAAKTHSEQSGAARVGIIHAGGLAPGMNPAARAAVKLGIDRGYTMVGIEGGFPGLLEGKTRVLEWGDVEGWAEDGGAELGTRRTIPSVDQYYALSRAIENAELDALIVIGGFKGYKMAFDMIQSKDRYPGFNIPIVCVPASIDNNLPGSEHSIGADTALNTNVEILDKIRTSASASQRCFVAETMGRKTGYLALFSALSSGAEQVYLAETGITLPQLAQDTQRMVNAFKQGRHLYLVVRNEDASSYYTTDFLSRIFEEEGHNLFDVRTSVIGHAQQGGNPSPFDRTMAARIVNTAINILDGELRAQTKTARSFHVGMVNGVLEAMPLTHIDDMMDMDARTQIDPWWLPLKHVVYVVSDPTYSGPLEDLAIVS
ncbi:6-phosphofructokinase [Arcanobacterium pinnipediorum]|uniref:6-phosphofructokinase n=1 Tax=Arcanobacterium pinnipediorum TaxID=1503041 RepID=A0ABY5AFP1_9ACTO|nr:6-phosphofructokinase [Arcanobacterium pinnipediorum]USR78995.1 6-phosphofructokinase [Arcanobacterium pinnipediorum]